MSALPLYQRPWPERMAAREDLAAAIDLAEGAVLVVAHHERRVEDLAAALRAAGAELIEARRVADECERLAARAAGAYERVHGRATPHTRDHAA